MAANSQDYHTRPDGEYFADTPTKAIPPANSWESLSTNQLVEIQVNLQTKAWDFRGNPAMASALNASLMRVQAIISQKLADNS